MAALLEALKAPLAPTALEVFGAVHDEGDTVVLLGPREPGFWAAFSASCEYQDGEPDPLDRWSKRVISDLAEKLDGAAIFPSDGPPYAPFMTWAVDSGQAWQSPVGMLVHARAGLMVSYRGALRLPELYELPSPAAKPCESCAQPCLEACPVAALNASHVYDVPACKTHASAPEGISCRTEGCLVRRICPVSQTHGRLPEQSAFHMRSFL